MAVVAVFDMNDEMGQAMVDELADRAIYCNVNVADDREAAAQLLEQQTVVERVDRGDEYLTVTLTNGHADYSDLASVLIGAGHKLTLLREDELNLETAFMALTEGITS